MLLSMTGYAIRSLTLSLQSAQNRPVSVQLSCEIKTVNNRFLEVSSRLPSLLMPMENSLLLACKQLLRGKVYLTINLTGQDLMTDKINLSLQTARQYFNAMQLLSQELGLDGNVKIAELIKMPGVINLERTTLDPELQQATLNLLQDTLADLALSRATEGQNLLLDLKVRLENCKVAIDKIKAAVGQLLAALQTKVVELELQLKDQPENQQLQSQLEEARHELDKSDIHEELVRFSSHLLKCQQLFAGTLPEKGKQLDFICQELLRETNTIAAKSGAFEIIENTVAIKVELEKIKEQVQNLV